MLPLPTFQPRKPFHRRTRAEAPVSPPPPPPPPPTVYVGVVTIVDEFTTDWEFSAAVTTDGSGAPEIVIDTFNGPLSPALSEQVSPLIVRYIIEDGGIALGQAWQLNGQPGGLDMHGQGMIVPESGIVMEL